MTNKEKAQIEEAIDNINLARQSIVTYWTPERAPFLDKVDDSLVDATANLRSTLNG